MMLRYNVRVKYLIIHNTKLAKFKLTKFSFLKSSLNSRLCPLLEPQFEYLKTILKLYLANNI
jgi:hypothetical protein